MGEDMQCSISALEKVSAHSMAAIFGLTACLALAVAPARAACPSPKELPDAQLKKSDGGYLNDKQIHYACWNYLSACSDRGTATISCKAAGIKRKGQLKDKVQATPTGVCNIADAEKQFFKTEKTFQEIYNGLDAAVKGLNKTDAGSALQYKLKSFGPAANAKSQVENRKSAQKQLNKVYGQFKADIKKYSTLSSVDCFDCSVLDTYAVLKSAANVISHTYSSGLKGTMVGLSSNTDKLAKTDEEGDGSDESKASTTATEKNLIAKPAPSNESLTLNQLSRQWVGALDTGYVKQMKDVVCELVEARKKNPTVVHNPKAYYKFAVRMQLIVNKLWDPRTEKYDDAGVTKERSLPSYFELAETAATITPPDTVKMKALSNQYGPNGSDNNKKCPVPDEDKKKKEDLELKAFSPTPYNNVTETFEPSWCKTP